MGSDHEVFEAAGFRVPMVYFHDYPDVTIHTQKDQPENLDATKLGRVAYLGAGIAYTLAALPDAEAPRLLAAHARGGRGAHRGVGARRTDPTPLLVRREAIASGIADARVGRAAVAVDRAGGRRRRRAPAREHAGQRPRPPTGASRSAIRRSSDR